jgi:dipeptidyl aminopeptidase/acylaminoacyl peptidase
VVTGSRYKADGSSSLACGWRRIFVVDLRTSRLESLPAAAANDDSPAWSPDGGQLAFSREIQSNLHYSVSDLWVHDLRHGRLRQLSHRVPHAVAPSWSPDGGRVAFYGASEQRLGLSDTGYGVFVLSPETGRCIGVTERDDRPVAMGEVAASAPPPLWSERGDALVYRVASRGDIHVVELPLAGGLARTLVGGRRQVLSVSMARSGLAYVASDCVSAPTLFAADRCGDHERPLLKLNTDRIATRVRVQRVAFEMSPPSGGVRDAWLFGPRRRNRPLPLLVDVHGGPHGFVGDYFSQGHFYRYVLASRGWLVLMLNATGSGSYGQRFADAIQGRWGRLDGPEHLAAASELVRCGLADRERLAISGYSYGGYLAAWLISHSRRFKAAVIGAPIIDLNAFMAASDIGRWYVPLEMRCREQPNPRLLLGRSPLAYLRRVRTPTFVYHGELDQRCPVGQSEALHTALHGRVPIQFVRYPDSSHGFVSSGRPSFRVDVNRRIVSWLEQHVLGIAPTPEPNPQRGVVVT